MTTENTEAGNVEDWLDREVRRLGGIEKIPQREWESLMSRCSRCGGEIDAEGWCPNYCTDE